MKKRAYLFFAGEIENYDYIKEIIGKNENIYAADGGGRHVLNLGLKPKLILGDFDSLDKNILNKFSKECEVKEFPPNKNFSDGELLVQTIYDEYDEICIFGALGGRYDHSFFNTFLLEAYPKCRIVNFKEELFFLDKEYVFINEKEKRISFLPISKDNNISLLDFEYELCRKEVKRGESLTLSNIIAEKKSKAIVHKGSFLVIKER